MNPETAETVDWAQLVDSLEAFRQELTRLSERVTALETAVAVAPRANLAAPTPANALEPEAEPERQPEGLSEELMLVIAAAIAAFLGKRPHIRQIRLLGSPAWAEHGRLTIQASHALSSHHG
jgi:methylmalonyl-CoA carboxyltransferase large subunit